MYNDKPKFDIAANDAAHKLMGQMLRVVIEKMPDGADKFNGLAILRAEEISELAMDTGGKAANVDFDDQQSRQVLEYLTCVHAGMIQFMQQMGMEVPHE